MYGVSVEELAAWNGLQSPHTIYRGQQLRIKPPARTVTRVVRSQPKPNQARPSRPKPSQPKPSQPKSAEPKPSYPKTTLPNASRPKTQASASAPVISRPPAVAGPADEARQTSTPQEKVSWSWPAEGRLISTYNANSTGKKGVDIAGKTGDPVRAAASGKVVYAGSGLTGYGRLIIIKHNEDFLSAYAHNRKLIAKEGQWVKRGEVVALMGSSGTDRTELHFEIRKHGRPVDPLGYLPGR